MNIIATPKLFYTHALETYLIGGLLIFLIGLFLGWLLWRHCRAQAERVESLNDILRERQGVLTDKNSQLAKLVEDLSQEPTASPFSSK